VLPPRRARTKVAFRGIILLTNHVAKFPADTALHSLLCNVDVTVGSRHGSCLRTCINSARVIAHSTGLTIDIAVWHLIDSKHVRVFTVFASPDCEVILVDRRNLSLSLSLRETRRRFASRRRKRLVRVSSLRNARTCARQLLLKWIDNE